MTSVTSHLAQAALALPLIGTLLAFVLGRRNVVAFVLASVTTAAALGASVWLVLRHLGSGVAQDVTTLDALPLGPTLRVPLQLRDDATSALIVAVVLLVSLTVQLFARWYLYSDPRYRVFASSVALFTGAMVLVVLSNDVLLTLMGWEVMGWCSYLLIGHESERAAARRAAFKAFVVTRLADAPFIVGLAALAMVAHTTRISDILSTWTHIDGPLRLAVLLGLVCGVLGKSAQLPFSDWLPDAMEGPTPASALIHAATMVAAGTVVLAQFEPLLALEPTARLTLVLVTGVTSLLAALAAFCQFDLKRLLAWSTVSQVGLMLLAVGAVPPGDSADAALLHLVGHAFFKSMLFLLLGWLSVVIGSTLASRMSGSLRRLPRTFVPATLGLFTMAGLPPTIAFVSKDAMINDAARSQADGHVEGLIGFIMLFLIVAATAAYSMRAWLILQHRTTLERRGERQVLNDSHVVRDVDIVELLRTSPEVDEHGEEIAAVEEYDEDEVLPRPGVMVRFMMWVLALGGIFGGALALTPLIDIDTRHLNLPMMGATVLLVLASVLVVRIMSLRQLYGDASRRLPRRMTLLATRGFGLDRAYLALARPIVWFAHVVHGTDLRLAAAHDALPAGMARLGDLADAPHTRRPSTGLSWVIVGVVVASVVGVTLW